MIELYFSTVKILAQRPTHNCRCYSTTNNQERERERQTDRQTKTETERDKDRETETETERQRERERAQIFQLLNKLASHGITSWIQIIFPSEQSQTGTGQN